MSPEISEMIAAAVKEEQKRCAAIARSYICGGRSEDDVIRDKTANEILAGIERR